MSDTRFVYADYAATKPLYTAALTAMQPYFQNTFCNPNSMYGAGVKARTAVNNARAVIAEILSVTPQEVYFTGSATEAANWAIKGTAELNAGKGKHIIASPLEHPAVMQTLEYLQKAKGYELTFLPADAHGQINPADMEASLRPDTVLAVVMTANNEIGTILPVCELSELCRARNVPFFTDATQAVGHIPVDASQFDMLCLSAHKFGGPKGTGALILRQGLKLPPLLHGGGQENNARSGTENVPGIAGMAAALRESAVDMTIKNARLTAMRDRLIEGLLTIPDTALTGDPVNRLPGLASFIVRFAEGESLVLKLDYNGICASTGSACSSNSLEHSHVLMAVGIPEEEANCSLRISLDWDNTDDDIDYIIAKTSEIVTDLRERSKGIQF
jgi:cysteine desulfurase